MHALGRGLFAIDNPPQDELIVLITTFSTCDQVEFVVFQPSEQIRIPRLLG
jgi:hypothetical protein